MEHLHEHEDEDDTILFGTKELEGNELFNAKKRGSNFLSVFLVAIKI